MDLHETETFCIIGIVVNSLGILASFISPSHPCFGWISATVWGCVALIAAKR